MKLRFPSRTAIMRIGICAYAVAAMLLLFRYPPTPYGSFRFSLDTTPKSEHENIWLQHVKDVGGSAAYADFNRYSTSIQRVKQHTYAHLFGAALYEADGRSAFAVCSSDETYQYGCLHEFFRRAINEYGATGLQPFVDECVKVLGKTHPCEHAMGHGLVSNYGYTFDGLTKTADVCWYYFKDDPINGCFGGMYMEYNLYTSLGLEVTPRDTKTEGWHGICAKLSGEAQRSCYSWLPQWWMWYLNVNGKDLSNTQKFVTIGDYCRTLPSELNRRECIQHLGQMIPIQTGSDGQKSLAGCKSASTNGTEELLCRSYAAYILRYYSMPEKGALMCEGLPDTQKAFCDRYASGKAYAPHDPPLPDNLPPLPYTPL